jgi:branched-chain amino acid transport system permease protein
MGILIVEHDMDFVMSMVDLLVVMDFGTHITTGAANEVRTNPRVIEAYLGSID